MTVLVVVADFVTTTGFAVVPDLFAGSPAKLKASSGFIQKATTEPARNSPMEPRKGRDQL